jgi:hypothetical protein
VIRVLCDPVLSHLLSKLSRHDPELGFLFLLNLLSRDILLNLLCHLLLLISLDSRFEGLKAPAAFHSFHVIPFFPSLFPRRVEFRRGLGHGLGQLVYELLLRREFQIDFVVQRGYRVGQVRELGWQVQETELAGSGDRELAGQVQEDESIPRTRKSDSEPI